MVYPTIADPNMTALNYWLGEASASYAGATALIGYESLGGNGAIGFSTPLATIHGFDGWADMFLATPVNGLNDLYGKASYTLPADFIGMKALIGNLYYRSFRTDNLNADLGHEWDMQAELGGSADKSIFWLQAAYKY